MLKDRGEKSKVYRFRKAETDLIENLTKNTEINNIGFYSGFKDNICGVQTLRIKDLCSFLALANKVIDR